MTPKDSVKALLFDVFGTVVDWRGSVVAELTSFGRARGIEADWTAIADSWRALYEPALEEVRAGRRPFVVLDTLHAESLDRLIRTFDLPEFMPEERQHLVTVWHRLRPWADVVEGLYRLKRRFVIGTLSNGNIALMVNLARHSGLPWDVILGAEIAQAYKPQPAVYERSVRALGLMPAEVMLVAAHNDDLAAARRSGLRTAFVLRAEEYGPHQVRDKHASEPWDIVTDSFNGVADALGCPRVA